MSYTRLRLVRHAEADHIANPNVVAGRAPWSNLTAQRGWSEALRLGQAWREEGYDPQVAHSSPLSRAVDTLGIALDILPAGSLQIQIYDELAEQCLGSNEGKERKRIYTPRVMRMIKDDGAAYKHPGRNSEGIKGQSLLGVAQRMWRYATLLRQDSESPQEVVAMGHHVAIKALVSLVELRERRADQCIYPRQLNERVIGRSAIEPCGQTSLIIEGGPPPENVRIAIEYVGQPLPTA